VPLLSRVCSVVRVQAWAWSQAAAGCSLAHQCLLRRLSTFLSASAGLPGGHLRCCLTQVTAAMRPECVPEYAALGGGGGGLMGGSPSPSIGEVSGDGDSNGATVGDRRYHHVQSPSFVENMSTMLRSMSVHESCTLAQHVPHDLLFICLMLSS